MPHYFASSLSAYGAFAAAGGRYWTSAWPLAAREIGRWQRHAAEIPDPQLRAAALENLRGERGNLEGAAAFAVLAPRRRRRPLVRALVAFQVIYDVVDSLVEQGAHAEPAASRRLHQALRDAVTTSGLSHAGGYVDADDGGYLGALVDACRTGIGSLPSSVVVTSLAQEATARMIEYQALNHAPGDPERAGLAAWSAAAAPTSGELAWWEQAAAGASSLVVFALLAHAAREDVTAASAAAIAAAYGPVGALHVLLDSLADRDVDAVTGDHSLVAQYATEEEATARLAAIAAQAAAAVEQLPAGGTHRAIAAAMAAFYLSAVEPSTGVLVIAAPLGATVRPAVLVLRTRRRFG